MAEVASINQATEAQRKEVASLGSNSYKEESRDFHPSCCAPRSVLLNGISLCSDKLSDFPAITKLSRNYVGT